MSETTDSSVALEPVDFATSALNHARLCEAKGDRRAAMKAYAHAWRASAAADNAVLPSTARSEMFSMSLLINDTVFSSYLYRELISTFSLQYREMAALAHHDLGKLFRNAWQHGEIVNPSDAIKHFVVARDEFIALWEARNAALVEMDLAHIYMHIDKLDQAVVLLESARATWQSLGESSGAAEAALSIGDCLTLLGRNEEAVGVYQLAVEDFEVAGNEQQMALASERAQADYNTATSEQ